MHRSAGNRVVGSTNKHRCVTGLTKTTSESELERSRPVMDANETETRVRGGGPRRAAMKHWAPRVWPARLPSRSNAPLRALIVRRRVSHPISLSPAHTGNAFIRKFGFQRYFHYRKCGTTTAADIPLRPSSEFILIFYPIRQKATFA